jgi:hypothetical protein
MEFLLWIYRIQYCLVKDLSAWDSNIEIVCPWSALPPTRRVGVPYLSWKGSKILPFPLGARWVLSATAVRAIDESMSFQT